jgi:hypothetical protein
VKTAQPLKRSPLRKNSIPAATKASSMACSVSCRVSRWHVSGGTVFSYGDNYINDNGLPVSGSLTPVSMQ